MQFINNDQALATLPNAGVGQNLVSLAPCAVNQPHVHPRGTEISHITQGEGFPFVLLVLYTHMHIGTSHGAHNTLHDDTSVHSTNLILPFAHYQSA